MTSPEHHDVLVIGGGPAGAATSYWLGRAGHDVCFVEKKLFPREKTCGDGLTPRAVKAIDNMGLTDKLEAYHRSDGLRAVAHGITLELPWPEHSVWPSHGYVVRRCDLDHMVAQNAVDAGAALHQGTEAVRPLIESGLVVGAEVKDEKSGETREIHAHYVVIADGSDSRFGRDIGSRRNRSYPQGMAIRTYYESPLHADPWIESSLDVRDRQGSSLPGYGWIFPLGNGTINVGVGLLSTFRDFRSVDTSHLMAEFAATLPGYWEIEHENPVQAPTVGLLPMAGSVSPKVGPNWIVVGDAAGSINPFNGEGIDYAYETGQMAADLISEALHTGSGLALQRYTQMLDDEYGLYFKVARAFARIIGQPELMTQLTRVGMHSQSLMEWVLRIMANLLRDDELGPAEAAYRSVAAIARLVPEKAAS